MSSIVSVTIPNELRNQIENFIQDKLINENPYTVSPSIAEAAAISVWGVISSFVDGLPDDRSGAESLRRLIKRANAGGDLPPLVLKNCVREPASSSVQPNETRGYNYSGSEKDRMKKYFFTEWSSWIFALLLNHENVIHPSEHGGGNRFHLVSPISIVDQRLRDVGASTGGGKFQQHSDATAFNEFINHEHFASEIARLGADVKSLEQELDIAYEDLLGQLFCGKYIRVDATVLAGIYNKDTMTHVMTPYALQEHLASRGYEAQDLSSLANMAVAHMAGPADGEISGYVGTVAPPLRLNDDENIFSTCLNLADNRMRYVGTSGREKDLFARFVADARQAPVEHVLVEASDILFLPNSGYKMQGNVTHGRGALQDSDYAIEIEPSLFVRRAHCRQYLVSRLRDNKTSFLSKTN